MTPEQIQANRPAFEAWASALDLDVKRVFPGKVYSDCNTNYAWLAWQAAKADAVPACQLCADLDHFVQLARQATAAECADFISARHSTEHPESEKEAAEMETANDCADAIRAKFATKEASNELSL